MTNWSNVPAQAPVDPNGSRVPSLWVPQTGHYPIQGGAPVTDPNNGPIAAPVAVVIRDGLLNLAATVAQFHNSDNQALAATAYGLLAGGVAQLLNILGNLDRQRETGFDGAPAQGIATGAAQFAQYFQTTSATAIAQGAAAATITPAAMTGIQVGAGLLIDSGANQEQARVTALPTGTTATIVPVNGSPASPAFKNAHSGTYQVAGFLYNQERDAAGELDGASGLGTAVAAEYEYNSGGAGGANFDRARNLQGKGLGTGTISSGGGVGSTAITFAANPAGLQPGAPLLLTGGTAEVVYVAASYTAGTNPVPLQTAIANASHTGGSWDVYAPQGPGLSGLLAHGEGAEAMIVYDAASGNYFLVRSASADALVTANIPAEAAMLFNGATFDRARTIAVGDGAASTGIEAAGMMGQTGTGLFSPVRLASVVKNVAAQAVTAGTPVSIWTPAAGKKFRVLAFMLSLSVAGSVILKDGTTGAGATEFLRTPLMAAGAGLASPGLGNGYLSAAANNQCWIDVTATGSVSGFAVGVEE